MDLKTAEGLWWLLGQEGIGPKRAIAIATRYSSRQEYVVTAGEPSPARDVDVADLLHPDRRVEIMTWFDADYPPGLRDLQIPPAILWLVGSRPRHDAVAVVGTRHPDQFGEGAARGVAGAAAAEGLSIVSGLALGIDALAHAAALEAHGHTCAVVSGDVMLSAPKGNNKLAEQILEAGGTLVSEQPPGTRAEPRTLVARDRLQAALGRATVVAQSGIPSGTLHTVRFTLELDRPLVVCDPPEAWRTSPASAANLMMASPDGMDPKLLGASGKLRRRIANKRPLADLVLKSRSDYGALWDLIRSAPSSLI